MKLLLLSLVVWVNVSGMTPHKVTPYTPPSTPVTTTISTHYSEAGDSAASSYSCAGDSTMTTIVSSRSSDEQKHDEQKEQKKNCSSIKVAVIGAGAVIISNAITATVTYLQTRCGK